MMTAAKVLIALEGLAIVVLAIRENRLRASLGSLVVYLEAHMAKALADRSPWTRIPSETLAAVLGSKVRTIPTPKRFNRKPGPHPALRVRRTSGGGGGAT